MVLFDPVPNRKHLWGHFLWFGSWVFVTFCGIILTPDRNGHGTHTQLGLPPCPSTILFQRPCPGCGLTTSFTATIHGDFARAFAAHPFGPIFYVLFTLTAIACLYGIIRSMRFNSDTKQFNWALGSLVAVYLVYSGIRFAMTPDYRPVPPEKRIFSIR